MAESELISVEIIWSGPAEEGTKEAVAILGSAKGARRRSRFGLVDLVVNCGRGGSSSLSSLKSMFRQ